MLDLPTLLRNGIFTEVLPEMRERSEVIILDFQEINPTISSYKNVQIFFKTVRAQGRDPRLPKERQRFNDTFLKQTGHRYLIGRYLEDRLEMLRGSHIADEGRTLHLGIDLFSRDLEQVMAPYAGRVVRAACEPGSHGYGHYVILEHSTLGQLWYSFYGHLSRDLPVVGRKIVPGEPFAKLGDFVNEENGGWSRHLHFQILTELPLEGATPIGYTTLENRERYSRIFPDPRIVLGKIY